MSNATESGSSKTHMKCALVTSFNGENYGCVDSISISDAALKPRLNPKKAQMLVRVMACSISAGDTHVLSGRMIMIKPKLPFIPGMDICGEVVEKTGKVVEFEVGDIVVSNNGLMPVGGLAEFMVVDPNNTVKKPTNIEPVHAAACFSAVTALNASDHCEKGKRVLILGGSGGVGSAAISLAKLKGASFVATTSTQKEMCSSLGADVVIDYRKENWWELDEFITEKFDVIIDCIGGGNFYGKATQVLKAGKEKGCFLAVCGDDPRPNLSSWLKVLTYMVKLPGRPLYTSLKKRKYPKYIMVLPSNMHNGMKTVLSLMEDEKLRIRLDPSSPLSFSEEGIKNAFEIQGSGHAHGKVVVTISK